MLKKFAQRLVVVLVGALPLLAQPVPAAAEIPVGAATLAGAATPAGEAIPAGAVPVMTAGTVPHGSGVASAGPHVSGPVEAEG